LLVNFLMSVSGYFLPSAGAGDHDRNAPNSGHRVISRLESGVILP
jgi:hypothetical protein